MYWGLNYQATQNLRKQLDEGVYSDNQAITIAFPITIPYATDRDYERVDGEFEYKREYYKLVKQQLKNDTLFVVCIKDTHQKHLVGEMINFTKLTHDLPSSQTIKLFGNLLKDYTNSHCLSLIKQNQGWLTHFTFTTETSNLLSREPVINIPPPREV